MRKQQCGAREVERRGCGLITLLRPLAAAAQAPRPKATSQQALEPLNNCNKSILAQAPARIPCVTQCTCCTAQ